MLYSFIASCSSYISTNRNAPVFPATGRHVGDSLSQLKILHSWLAMGFLWSLLPVYFKRMCSHLLATHRRGQIYGHRTCHTEKGDVGGGGGSSSDSESGLITISRDPLNSTLQVKGVTLHPFARDGLAFQITLSQVGSAPIGYFNNVLIYFSF